MSKILGAFLALMIVGILCIPVSANEIGINATLASSVSITTEPSPTLNEWSLLRGDNFVQNAVLVNTTSDIPVKINVFMSNGGRLQNEQRGTSLSQNLMVSSNGSNMTPLTGSPQAIIPSVDLIGGAGSNYLDLFQHVGTAAEDFNIAGYLKGVVTVEVEALP